MYIYMFNNLDAYLLPLVSCCLITTEIRQRKKDIGGIKISNTAKRILGLCSHLIFWVRMCVYLCRLYLRIIVCDPVSDC